MIGTLYTPELIDDYMRRGFWDLTLSADTCDRNGRERPNNEALIDLERRLTWAEVSRETDQFALALHALGFKRDDLLVVQLPNRVELYISILAGEKAGVSIVTCQPTFRQAEMSSILKHVRARGVMVPHVFRDFNYYDMIREILPDLPDLKYIIFVGGDVPTGGISYNEIVARDYSASFPAGFLQKTRFKPYEITRIVTTSGTTGIPKCCEWPTCALMHAGRVLAKRWELTPDDVVGAFYNIIGAGLSYLSLYSVPLVGARVALLDHFTPQGFCELVQKEKITIAGIVPAEVARLLEYPDLDRYDLSSLRLLAHGTTVLPYELAVRAEKRLGCKFTQTYGAMDAGPLCSSAVADPQEVRLKTVGLPYDGTEIKILDNNGRSLPQGQLGEVVVRGPTCISGYYRNKELNDQTWKDGWFDTNNEGFFRPDGNLVLMGRRRDVIIRGGQNIYPKEIEDLLLQHPKLSEVAVVRMPDREMGEKACAYAVPRRGQQFTFKEMVAFLESKKIAPFKMPERLEVVSELPLAPAGNKVDVTKLEKDIAGKLQRDGRA